MQHDSTCFFLFQPLSGYGLGYGGEYTLLTNKIIDGARPKAKQYKLADSQGLYITIMPGGTKSWRFDYKLEGKYKTHVFGRYPEIGLAHARLLLLEFKNALATGMAKASPTFDEIKAAWYLQKLPTLKNIKHKQQVQYRLDTFVSPKIGHLPIDAIKRDKLVEVVQAVQKGGIVETAHRVGMHMRQVFDYAVDLGKIESHPAANLSRVLATPKVDNMPCVAVKDAGKLFKAINGFEHPITRLGLMLVAYTFVRTNEVRYMQWDEIRDKRFWVIPAERMKGRKEHRKPHVVPLSDRALAVLKELKMYTGDDDYVLQSPVKRNKPISENTLIDGLYSLGYRHKMTVHGFRALASTVLNEQSPFGHDVIERQLSHKETDAVRAAYNRAEYLDERIKLMDWWANWVYVALMSPETT